MEPLPLPTTLAEVEGLIQALYQQSNPPKTINAIQEVLQRLQKSDQGWHLAESLISHSDPNIKFFAALTLIVKLNKESTNLSEDEAKELLQNVINWVLGALVDGTANFVVKKLCSALVTHFIYFSHVWPRCFRQLLYCMDIGRGVAVESLDDALETRILVASLDDRKIWLAIHFALALVEEVGKTDMSSPKYIHVHERLVKNAPDVACLLSRAFDGVLQSSYGQPLLSCYQAWILYAQRASITSQQHLVPLLRELVEPAMKCFTAESLFQEATGLFTDIFQNYSSFFTDAHYDAMFAVFESPWGTRLYEQVRRESSNPEIGSFGIMMLAYGDAKVHGLMESVDQRSQGFLNRLVGLLDADGYLVGEDTIFVPALEFWLTFAETMVDFTFSNDGEVQPWRPYADGHLKNVVINSWKKIRWPPAEVFADWDLDERTGFNDARKDVADLLQSIFTLNGVALVSFFVDLFLQSLQKKSWPEVEASLFCFSAFSDCVTDDAKYDNELARVFSAPFFELLGEGQGAIPLRLRQTGLSLVGRCCEYFERHSEYLPHALNLLFAAVGDPVLGASSARSISTLCSSCRTVLIGETEAFIRQYQTIRGGQVLDSIAEEKILHAIGSIIQAIPDEEARLSMFEALYTFLKQDVERAVQLKVQPSILNLADPNFSRGLENWSSPQPVPSPDEIAQQIALRALRCLASLAKGMRDTRGKVVELESDSTLAPREGGLAVIQGDIIELMKAAQQTFPASGEVIEAICNIFRAGFSETEPGPFVFPAGAVTSFYIQQTLATPRLGTLLSSVCSFVGFLLRGPRDLVPEYLAQLLPWVVLILQSLPEPESDTEITLNGISLVDKIMSKYPAVLFALQPPQLLEFFFLFTLKVLDGKEPLPKCAAADFWSDFITLKSDDPGLQATIRTAMDQLGPLFTQTLIRNIGGNAARSEIDKLSDPLKKLVVQQPRAQAWLELALSHDFPSTQVTEDEKRLFLKKILGLRGARQTNNVVRDFWLACRGSNFAYAS